MENECLVDLDYKREYARIQEEMKYRLEEQEKEIRNFYENKIEDMLTNLVKYEKEIEFYKNIIKSILHIGR